MSDRLKDVVRWRLALLPPALRYIDPAELLKRDAPGGLVAPDYRSANRLCRLFPAREGWLALNLARSEDLELVPALIGDELSGDPWDAVAATARNEDRASFLARAIELQIPIAALGEAKPSVLSTASSRASPRRVIDLSGLWAGPLCAGLLMRAGAEVLRIESRGRPDPTPRSSPELDQWINGGKLRLTFDFADPWDRKRLLREIAAADVLVTSARPAALASLGLSPENLLADCPRLIWAAITAHGFTGAGASRVGFGDDCAVAGGLVRWEDDAPRFLGDALADPLTGLEAALAVFERLDEGRTGLLDMAMARIAAAYSDAAA